MKTFLKERPALRLSARMTCREFAVADFSVSNERGKQISAHEESGCDSSNSYSVNASIAKITTETSGVTMILAENPVTFVYVLRTNVVRSWESAIKNKTKVYLLMVWRSSPVAVKMFYGRKLNFHSIHLELFADMLLKKSAKEMKSFNIDAKTAYSIISEHAQ